MKLKNHLIVLTVLFMGISISSCCKKVAGCKTLGATNYNQDADTEDPCLCRFNGIFESCDTINPGVLNIPPVMQQTANWCWLAVGEMVFKYYGLKTVNPGGDYQCGIIGVMGYYTSGACNTCFNSCYKCPVPAGTPQTISAMLSLYPKFTYKQLNSSNKTLKNNFTTRGLTYLELIAELDSKRPVIAGINPGASFIVSGNSQHVALITGYFYDGNNNLILNINDPYPYPALYNPYLFAGGVQNGNLMYKIPYNLFYNNLFWNTSWYNISW